MVVGPDLVLVDEVPVQIVQFSVALLHGGPAESSGNRTQSQQRPPGPPAGRSNSHVAHQAGVLRLDQHVPDVVGVVGHFCR